MQNSGWCCNLQGGWIQSVASVRSWHQNMLQLNHVKEACAEEPCTFFPVVDTNKPKKAKIGGDLSFHIVYESNKTGA